MPKSVAKRLTMNETLDSYSGNFGDCCIWNGMPCNLSEAHQHFTEIYCFNNHDRRANHLLHQRTQKVPLEHPQGLTEHMASHSQRQQLHFNFNLLPMLHTDL